MEGSRKEVLQLPVLGLFPGTSDKICSILFLSIFYKITFLKLESSHTQNGAL